MALIQFLIGGAQKSGTSALAQYLGAHPDVRLPLGKEAHVFDRQDFDENWPSERIDAEYADHLSLRGSSLLCGDATPFYVFHPRAITRIARYNPTMKWIILLRDPVDRAISHYYMERDRGFERLPLWSALALERWRLHGRSEDLSDNSPLRHHSYRARGCYVQQLETLYASFPREQVLLLRSMDLRATPGECMQRVHAFLGLASPGPAGPFEQVFSRPGQATQGHRWIRRALRLSFRRELRKLQAQHGVRFDN